MNDHERYCVQGTFYYHGEFVPLTIEVNEGTIVRIARSIKDLPTVKLAGAIFPGSIDSHVHFRDPGETWKEDFVTGSMSALFGGTTAVVDMPNNIKPIDNYDAYSSKLGSISHRSYVDYGLASMFTGNNAEILHPESALIKTFLGGSTNSVEVTEFSEKQLDALNELGSPNVFHMELGSCLKAHSLTEEILSDHERARPEECEITAESLVRTFTLSRKIGAHCSVFYEDLHQGFEALEVTPHHLLLNTQMDLGSEGKVNPPLRSVTTQRTLLQAFVDGKFDFVSSDHAPHTDEDKEDFPAAKSGIIGVETRLPLMAALLGKRILTTEVFTRTLMERPAEVYGFNKGKIEVGFDADFIALDLRNISKVREDRLHSKRTVSPFDGWDAIFPTDVIVRGHRLIDKYELVDERAGQYIPFKRDRQQS